MKTLKVQKALILVSIVAGALAGGCELIVDFDRTKIPVETIDAAANFDASSLGDGAVTGDAATTTDASSDASDADTQEQPDSGDSGIQDAATDG